MKRTEGGRVIEEQLAELEEAAGRYPKPWTMGVGSYVMKALVAEIRECRGEGDLSAPWEVTQPADRYEFAVDNNDAALIVQAVNSHAAALDLAELVLADHHPVERTDPVWCYQCHSSVTWPCPQAAAALRVLDITEGDER